MINIIDITRIQKYVETHEGLIASLWKEMLKSGNISEHDPEIYLSLARNKVDDGFVGVGEIQEFLDAFGEDALLR